MRTNENMIDIFLVLKDFGEYFLSSKNAVLDDLTAFLIWIFRYYNAENVAPVLEAIRWLGRS